MPRKGKKKKKGSTLKKRPAKSSNISPTRSSPNPEIPGLMILTIAFVMFLSLLSFAYGHISKNWLGLLGYTVGWSLHLAFGLTSYLITGFLGWIGWRMLFSKSLNRLGRKTIAFAIMIVSLAFLLNILEDSYPSLNLALGNTFYTRFHRRVLRYHLGGAPFYFLYRELSDYNLLRLLNTSGIVIICSATFLSSFLFLLKVRLEHVVSFLSSLLPRFKKKPSSESFKEKENSLLRYVKLRLPSILNPHDSFNKPSPLPQQDLLAIHPETNLKTRPSLSQKEYENVEPFAYEEKRRKELGPPPDTFASFSSSSHGSSSNKALLSQNLTQNKREEALRAQKVYNGDFTNYRLPPLHLLSNPKKVDQTSLKKDLKRQAEVLEETLLSFGIEAKVGQINCGPTITSFEVHPAIGVKVQKIKALENDIALNMEAKSIRIIAPIPGKAAVGIEVPNADPQEVGFKDMLNAYQRSHHKFHIPLLLGKAVNGDYVMSDLTRMPHCIIAGATGSGKSVCINTIVMSLLFIARPDEIKLLMVDPKKVELTPYTSLPHMIAPVITEPQGACAALRWLVKEMESRYEILKLTGVRNITAFNNRQVDQEFEASLDLEIPERIPYIVALIDELADLMMVSSSDIETPIARIAQMARAVGIHLILATQRPSREVITGLIKANFPTRISFKVASRVNSQIVLDEIGAEALLGNGDMLFLPPGASHLIRAQGAYIRDEDINAVINFICDQAPPSYLIPSFDTMTPLEALSLESPENSSADALYNQALDIVLGTGNASTTFLQRKLKIGYARAASLIDQLEANNIVGPPEGSKPRRILVSARKQGLSTLSDEEQENE